MTVTLVLPAVLRDSAEGQKQLQLAEGTVAQILDQLRAEMPKLERRVRDEQGEVRRHVKLYLDRDDITDLQGVDTPARAGCRLYIIPAVSGGR